MRFRYFCTLYPCLGVETMLLPVYLLPQHLVPCNGSRGVHSDPCLKQTCLFLSVHKHKHAHIHWEKEHSHLPHREQAVWRELQLPCWNLSLYVVCCSLSPSLFPPPCLPLSLAFSLLLPLSASEFISVQLSEDF